MVCKKKAAAVSDIIRGHEHMHAQSHHLDRLSLSHSFRNTNFMHQCSRKIIDWCTDHEVGVLVIGRNKNWKQNADMGKKNNQKFESVPHSQLLQLIEFKAMKAESGSLNRRSPIRQRLTSAPTISCLYTVRKVTDHAVFRDAH